MKLQSAYRAYAKLSQDYDLTNWATEIRIRSERRMGEMLKEQKEAGLTNVGVKGQLQGSDSSGGRSMKPPEIGGNFRIKFEPFEV